MNAQLLTGRFSSWVVVSSLIALACGGGSAQLGAPGTSASESNLPQELQSVPQLPESLLCSEPQPGMARCHAHARTNANGSVQNNTTPSGLVPADIQNAYALPATGGHGAWVAIVDAHDNPNAESDLATYRAQFGLPACTTANGCFKKVNQNGVQGSYPAPDNGWAGEIALDLDMVSAACPDCRILLVEANSANMNDLGASVNTAVQLGAAVVSNSYGGPEDSTINAADSQFFNHPGVAIFASAGDSGFGAQYPATSQYVTAVGGTSLARSTRTSRGWVEGTWGSRGKGAGGTGSGCSAFIAKPSWQSDKGCAKRMESDVSAVADPNTGVAVYNTYASSGWAVFGGTSAASPIVAAVYALTGHASEGPGFSYANTSAFFDVTAGTNGTCSTSYFCTAGTGYDGPTGNGTPNGAALLGKSHGGGNVQVTFRVDNATTFWGQNVFLVGDAAELGSWDPQHAVALSPTAYPSWTGTVSLPAGKHLSFKFIKMDGQGGVTWENGGNLQLDVPTGSASGQFTGSWQ